MKRLLPVFSLLAALIVLVTAASLLLGKGLPFGPSFQALLNPEPGTLGFDVVWRVRLPRLLLALIVGAGLAGTGSVFQGMLRNPLADPFTLGISGGAALGATAVQIFVLGSAVWFLPGAMPVKILGLHAAVWVLPGAAFAGAMLATVLVAAGAARARFSGAALILAGVVLSFFFSSLVYLLLAVARPNEAHNALLWLMGDLSSKDPVLLRVIAPPVLLGLAGLWILARDLNALTLGDEKARSLGVEPLRTRKRLFALAALVTGASVAAAGIVGFVGLMVPHFLRPFTGPDHRLLVPASVLGGAVLLAGADTLARWAVPRHDLPVGVVTGIIGGLFLLGLLVRRKGFRFF